MPRILITLLAACVSFNVLAHDNRIDIIRQDAPTLAHFGDYDIGVRTLELTDPNRPDVLNTKQGGETAYYDRRLTVEVCYPALLNEDQQPGGDYTTTTRNPTVTATLHGRAVRDAGALTTTGAMPLIIVSHGYPGNRYLLTYVDAGHNAGAPIPVPVEILSNEDQTGASHYTDPVWDSVRMNNIMDHFATAFFDYHLKDSAKSLTYLQNHLKGFGESAARGLLFEHLLPTE